MLFKVSLHITIYPEDGSTKEVPALDNLAIKGDLQNKINQFKSTIENSLVDIKDSFDYLSNVDLKPYLLLGWRHCQNP